MAEKLFKNKIFYYIFVIFVIIDLLGIISEVFKHYSFTAIKVLNIAFLILSIAVLISCFIDLKINHLLFKIYIYLRSILSPILLILFIVKDPILYGIHLENYQRIVEISISLALGIILLIFYNKYKFEPPQPNP